MSFFDQKILKRLFDFLVLSDTQLYLTGENFTEEIEDSTDLSRWIYDREARELENCFDKIKMKKILISYS